MTDRKMPRDNDKLSLAPLQFEEALANLLRVNPPQNKPTSEKNSTKKSPPPSSKKQQRDSGTT